MKTDKYEEKHLLKENLGDEGWPLLLWDTLSFFKKNWKEKWKQLYK